MSNNTEPNKIKNENKIENTNNEPKANITKKPHNILHKKQLFKEWLKFVISSVAAMWIFTIYTMVDGIFVARGVGTNALAAVNIVIPFINISFAISIIFAVGGGTRSVILRGKGLKSKANQTFTRVIATVSIISLLITLFSILFSEELLYLLGARGSIIPYAKNYFNIIILFDFFYMVSYTFEVLVKSDGSPEKAILFAGIGAISNMILDYLFIFVIKLGITGAALATGISQAIAFFLLLHHFLSKKSNFSFTKFKPSLKALREIATLGLPDFTTEVALGIVVWAFNIVLGKVGGVSAIAIYTVITYISTLVVMTMVGINQGMQPLVSTYYSKGMIKSKIYLFKISVGTATSLSFLAFIICFFFPETLTSMFINPDSKHALFLHGIKALKLYSLAFIPLGTVIITGGYFTAIEKPLASMAISISRSLILILISLFFMALLFGETGVWLSASISETLTLIIAGALYYRHKKHGC